MSTQSLKNYLLTRPTSIGSASALARTYGVDVKSATRILRSCGYALVETPQGQLWQHSPLSDPAPPKSLEDLALADLRFIGVADSVMGMVASKIPTGPQSSDPPTNETIGQRAIRQVYNLLSRTPTEERDTYLTALLLTVLTFCHERDMLPIRSEITQHGFKPLTQPKADN